MAIDMHAHWLPEALHNAMQADGFTPRKFDSLDERLQEMDASGYTHAVLSCVDRAIEANPDVAEKIRDGKVAAAGALIGAVMKEMRGQADAGRVRELILEKLS